MAKRKITIILGIAFLMTILVLFGLYLCLSVNWWDRPLFDNDKVQIEVFEGRFQIPGNKPVKMLNPDSQVGSMIIKDIEESWRDHRVLLFPSHYVLNVIYANGDEDIVCIGASLVSIESHSTEGKKVYRSKKNISEIIKNAIESKESEPNTHPSKGSVP